MSYSKEDLDLLLQAHRILAAKLDISDLLRTVMELAARVLKAEAASILLLDEKTQELYFDVALGQAGRQVKQVRLKPGEGLAGWVAKHQQAAVVNNVKADPRWSDKADERSDFSTRQVLAVPLISKGKFIGVVEGLNKKDGTPFSEEDCNYFEAFASQAAVALENARLFAEVKGEKEKLSTVFAEMSDGALLADDKGRVLLMNQAAGHYFGFKPEDVIGKMNLRDLVKPFLCLPSVDAVFTGKEPVTALELKRISGKSFYLSASVKHLANDQGQSYGYLFVLRDVTEVRKEELLKRNFLSLISHKLKTPLVTIAGYAPLLLEDKSSFTDFQKKALTTIKNQGIHLSSLVDKLLTFSLVESETLTLEPKSASVKEILTDVLNSMRTYLEAQDVQVAKDASLQDLPPVNVDTERVQEVLKNLIENGIKFNDKPKKILRVKGSVNGEMVRVEVEDNGTGIPSEEHPRIFQKFYQIEESFTGQVEGAGLGLALARRIVEAHEGTIGVDSVMGRGSVFFFTLPKAKDHAKSPAAKKRHAK